MAHVQHALFEWSMKAFLYYHCCCVGGGPLPSGRLLSNASSSSESLKTQSSGNSFESHSSSAAHSKDVQAQQSIGGAGSQLGNRSFPTVKNGPPVSVREYKAAFLKKFNLQRNDVDILEVGLTDGSIATAHLSFLKHFTEVVKEQQCLEVGGFAPASCRNIRLDYSTCQLCRNSHK